MYPLILLGIIYFNHCVVKEIEKYTHTYINGYIIGLILINIALVIEIMRCYI